VTAIGASRRGSFPHGVMLGWLVIAAAPVVLSDDGIPHALRSVLLIPPVFVLAAVGAHRAYCYSAARVAPALQVAVLAVFFLALCYLPYHTYFDLWAPSPKVASAFDAGLIDLAEQVNALGSTPAKYIAVATGGDLANGIPLSVEPVVYLTRSYTTQQQNAANIHYLIAPAGEPAAGFCERVGAAMPGAAVFCVQ